MIPPDGRSVAVAGEDYHGELGTGHLDACGDGKRPAVDGMHRVQIDVPGGPARTADAAHYHGVLAFEAEVEDGTEKRSRDDAHPAPRAPDVGQPLPV